MPQRIRPMPGAAIGRQRVVQEIRGVVDHGLKGTAHAPPLHHNHIHSAACACSRLFFDAQRMIWTPSTRIGTRGAILEGANRANRAKESTMKIRTIGIDLGMTTLSVHAIDAHGKTVMHKSLPRTKLIAWMSNLEPCLVGMEACSGAHDLARRLIAMGHDARHMAARFVQPYRKNQKNDANGAEAICEAIARPSAPSRADRAQRPPPSVGGKLAVQVVHVVPRGQIELACDAPVTCRTWMSLVSRWFRLGKQLASVSK